MFRKKSTIIVVLTLSLLYFTGCNAKKLSVEEGGYYQSGVYFGSNFSKEYKRGIRDGCTTAKGDYRKSHRLFRKSDDYHKGWFLGRSRCKHLLVVEGDEKNTTIIER
ncbi:MAG: hypothetical protein QM493_06110 [Sulfurovum sp.]